MDTEILDQTGPAQGVRGFWKYTSDREVFAALFEARKEFKPVIKNAENPYYSSKYADLQSLIEATEPALQKHGLVITQLPGGFSDGKFLSLTTIVYHTPSGQSIQTTQEVPAYKSGKDSKDGVMRIDAQSYGSALSYARRYAYQSILGLVAEDDDGNGTVEREEEEAAPKTRKPRKAKTDIEDATSGVFPNKDERTKIAVRLRALSEDERLISKVLRKLSNKESSKEVTKAEWETILPTMEEAAKEGKLEALLN